MSLASVWRRLDSPVFRMRRVLDRIVRPIQRPLGRRLAVQTPELGGGVQRVHRLAGAAGQDVQRPGQVRQAERLRGAAQIRSPAPQISLVLSLSAPKPPGRGPVIVKPSVDSTGTSCRMISAPSPGGLGPMSWPTPCWRRPSAINVTPSTRSSSTGPRPLPMSLAMSPAITAPCEKPDQHVAGQRALGVHVRHRLDRRAGALGPAVVVGDLRVAAQRVVELRGVGNGVRLDPAGVELLARSAG